MPGQWGLRQSASGVAVGWIWPLMIATVVTCVPVWLHLAGQGVGIAACILLASIVANYAARAVPTVLILSYLCQNLAVALVSTQIHSADELNPIRAYNFVLTVTIWAIIAGSYWLGRRDTGRRMRVLMDATTGALALVGLYFLLGLASNPGNAAVYLRNIATPILLVQIFAVVSYKHRISLISVIAPLAVFALLYGYVELFWHDELFPLVNGDRYIGLRLRQDYEAGVWLRELHQTGRVLRGYLDTLAVDFLNTPLLPSFGLRLYRLVGPNFHSISFAYALAGFGVALWALGHWWFGALALPLVLFIGSKGALAFLLLTIGALVLVRHVPQTRRLWLFAAILVAYAAAGIAVGLNTQDYHVIGFVGGLRGFLSNPLGHGIGAGGNLSLNVSAMDWSRSQNVGHTDVAVESALGVLLYQMGIGAIIILLLFGWMALMLWRSYRRSGDRLAAAAAIGILTVAVNGIFQEEALFSPLGLGVMTSIAGSLLGTAYADDLHASATG